MEGCPSWVIMDLLGACWMIRSLEQSIASVALDKDNNLIAGGWDGQIRKWNIEGDLIWTQLLPDRISEIVFFKDRIIVTSGLHIVNLESKSGEVKWQKPLEGSADSLVVVNDQIYATSSVYDIEHNDFLESAIWNFSASGNQEWVIKIDERPWSLLVHNGKIMAGLGRPKSGWAEILPKGKIVNHSLDTKSPIMCGVISNKGALFGHADGSISTKDEISNKFSQSVESLDSKVGINIASLEGGTLVRLGDSRDEKWSEYGDAISNQVIGFKISKINTHWATRWSGTSGCIEVRNTESGELIADASVPQSRAIFANNTRVVVGSEDGKIHVWEQEMFERRLKSNFSDNSDESTQKSILKDKLRALRNR